MSLPRSHDHLYGKNKGEKQTKFSSRQFIQLPWTWYRCSQHLSTLNVVLPVSKFWMYKPPIAPIPTAAATSVAPRRQIFVPDRSFHMEALHFLQTLRIKSALVTDTWYESYEYSWISLDRAPIWRPKRLAVPMKREASHSWLRRPKRLKGWNHLKPLRKGQENCPSPSGSEPRQHLHTAVARQASPRSAAAHSGHASPRNGT